MKKAEKSYLAVIEAEEAFFARAVKPGKKGTSIGEELKVSFAAPEAEATASESDAPALDSAGNALTPPSAEELATALQERRAVAFKSLIEKTGVREVVPIVPSFDTVYTLFTIPEAAADTVAEAASLRIDTLSPFDEDERAAGYEILGIHEGQILIFAAAAPITLLQKWQDVTLPLGVKINRIGSTLLCWYRGLTEAHPETKEGRHLIVAKTISERILLVVDDGALIAARGVPGSATPAEVVREVMITLSNAELAFGAKALRCCLCVTSDAADAAPDRIRTVLGCECKQVVGAGYSACTQGLALRICEHPALDLTPLLWREQDKERALRKALIIVAAVMGAIWVLCALTLLAIPYYYTKSNKDLTTRLNAQKRTYDDVVNLQDRVALIERYTQRDYSALEILRFVCEVKPQGMVFSAMTFKQKQNLRLSGTASATGEVYTFKDALEKDSRIDSVKISRLIQDAKTRLQRFDLDVVFATDEEVEE